MAKGRGKALLFIAILGLICAAIVVLAAYAAELRIDNNKLIADNTLIQNEIDTLEIKIKSANNIEHIEAVATEQLGMIYADENGCRYLSEEDAPVGSLAMVIKENAYN